MAPRISRSVETVVIVPSVSSFVAYTTGAVGCAASHDGDGIASSRSGVSEPSAARRNVLIPTPLPPVSDV
jgi:hypothetical protein